ncbi:phosphatidylinositol 4,5-bisphosphate-binding protein [Friedmanniomyces endolithicus]|uniref:Phosphatidylinositol 4,5-bisphosphate-binding protein n=1 Tax=Friedmanniomyces endolithicus TaxID=329885 RepID=A0AAN6JC27_9PEZI|nr:phosphatidylinositol 4,5-bisphosphate-binding protein [Friedmanniomyces endolithicus]KAK0318944.1 phosphatidylinositol 4,5-bisphosphate-binding protein [Friedmanniomyces endolithicus]KAK0997377.1 phosphatidylinositol 4,5-bisphosphate-binding protein [Friedmanniomyces endolithicus]
MSAHYGSVPNPTEAALARGYGTHPNTGISDFALGNPSAAKPSPLAQSVQQPHGVFRDDYDPSQQGSSVVGDGDYGMDRSHSTASTAVPAQAPSRSNTLKKKASMRRTGSLKRSSSKRSLAAAGSIKGVSGVPHRDKEYNSIFYTPIPTQGTPTEVLANRFQAWRQLLKSLIAYFREIQNSYDARSKAVHKAQSVISAITNPSVFLTENGLGDATRILDDYHKHSIAEANKSRDIENDVIGALTGLRSDLGQKIKEIKSLSGDFKNSVDKEKEGTKREVEKLQEALQHVDHEDGSTSGKMDPFIVKLGVDKLVERQVDEENYLHRAYLNLESSGRELESIVVGEIQKAYNALAGILKREADDAYNVVEGLRGGPISLPKDQEWLQFVLHDPHFVDPNLPLRRIVDIDYPGKHNPAATEVRAGMLERKSKYLKSYTPGWYVLSPTHLHEFKSADKIYTQPPVMSLYLLDQKLGSKSEAGSSSNKFMLKGKQSGRGHAGHNWVFRAETHDTMLAWYEDIRVLTESSGEARNAFVRQHARSVSGTSERGTVSSDGFEDDEADAEPYSADAASLAEANPMLHSRVQRPQPGGRFPSDLQVPRAVPVSPSSAGSSDAEVVASAGALPGSAQQEYERSGQNPYKLDGVSAGTRTISDYEPGPETANFGYRDETPVPAPQQFPIRSSIPGSSQAQQYAHPNQYAAPDSQQGNMAPMPTQFQERSYAQQPDIQQPAQQQPIFQQPAPQQPILQQPAPQQQHPPVYQQAPFLQPATYHPQPPQQPQQPQQPFLGDSEADQSASLARVNSMYGDWMAPAAGAAAGAGAGVMGAEYWRNQRNQAAVREGMPEQSGHRAEPAFMPAQPREREVERPGDNGNQTAFSSNRGAEAPTAATLPATTFGGFDEPAAVSNKATASEPVFSSGTQDNKTSTATQGLGGLERQGAHETGRFFPSIVRHDTNMSISALHVPGEYPKRG